MNDKLFLKTYTVYFKCLKTLVTLLYYRIMNTYIIIAPAARHSGVTDIITNIPKPMSTTKKEIFKGESDVFNNM